MHSHCERGIENIPGNAHLGRATCKPVFGVALHEVDLGRPRPGNFLLRSTEGLCISVLGGHLRCIKGEHKPRA